MEIDADKCADLCRRIDDDLVILSHPVESASFSLETKYENDTD